MSEDDISQLSVDNFLNPGPDNLMNHGPDNLLNPPLNNLLNPGPSTSGISNLKCKSDQDFYGTNAQEMKMLEMPMKYESESELYGRIVAKKLERLDPRRRMLACHQIDNILFDFESEINYGESHDGHNLFETKQS